MSEETFPGRAGWTVWRQVSEMRSAVERALEQRLQRDAGLSGADFEILSALSASAGHRLRSGALADSLGWEKSRISHQVRRMADRGLVERTECASDLRGTWVVLADRGADAFAAAVCGYTEVLSTVFLEPLSAAQREALESVSTVVRRALLAPDPQAAPAAR